MNKAKAYRYLPFLILAVLLIQNFNNGVLNNPKSYFSNMILLLPGIIIGITFHEFAHAFVSSRLGDPTPKEQGRITLNPRAHIDIYGFIALIFCGFGWGKPVQIDNRYYKVKRRDELLVSLAGILMNLLLALIFSLILRGWIVIHSNSAINTDSLYGIISTVLIDVVSINIVLAVFNLIPVPPLDGFSVINNIFDLERYSWFQTVYSNGFVILLLLLITGVISMIMTPITKELNNFFIFKISLGM